MINYQIAIVSLKCEDYGGVRWRAVVTATKIDGILAVYNTLNIIHPAPSVPPDGLPLVKMRQSGIGHKDALA